MSSRMDRRDFFQGSAAAAALAAGGLAGCATASTGTSGRTPFQLAGTVIPVVGSDEVFPVRRIYCIGRNYRAHAIEMGSNPDREPPFFFMKPADAVLPVAEGQVGRMHYPSLTKDLHHEVELVVATTTKPNWWRCWARAGATSRWLRRWTWSGATPWAWT